MSIRNRLSPPDDYLPSGKEVFENISQGQTLIRLHSKANYQKYGFGFNPTGPRGRWDHHLASADRSSLYTALELATAFIEIAMDTEEFHTRNWLILTIEVITDLKLLDLREGGCVAAGCNRDLVAPSCPRQISQAWSRHFHDHLPIDGILWESCGNGRPCIFLNERAETKVKQIKRADAGAAAYRRRFLELGFDYEIGIY